MNWGACKRQARGGCLKSGRRRPRLALDGAHARRIAAHHTLLAVVHAGVQPALPLSPLPPPPTAAHHALLAVVHAVVKLAAHVLLHLRLLRLRLRVHLEDAREHEARGSPQDVHVDVLAGLLGGVGVARGGVGGEGGSAGAFGRRGRRGAAGARRCSHMLCNPPPPAPCP